MAESLAWACSFVAIAIALIAVGHMLVDVEPSRPMQRVYAVGLGLCCVLFSAVLVLLIA